MKTIISIVLISFLFPMFALAQGNRFDQKFGPDRMIDSINSDFANRRVMEYPHVREADVMYDKVTWELIDLKEKFNLPLYYPTDSINNRYSLIQALLIAIKNQQTYEPHLMTVYDRPIKDNAFEFEFDNRLETFKELVDLRKDSVQTTIQTGPGLGGAKTIWVPIKWKTAEITQILIKEVWYFDKKDSRLRCEVIGICPMREYLNANTNLLQKERLCWIYYPYLRKYMAKIPVHNPLNDKALYSFDDVFVNRFYRSYFVQESNVYNDRMITDYVLDRNAQLESERIKKEIFDWEQDLWEN